MVGIGFAPLAVRCALIVFVNCVPTPSGKHCTPIARPILKCGLRVPQSKTLELRTTASSRDQTYGYYKIDSSPPDSSVRLGHLSILE